MASKRQTIAEDVLARVRGHKPGFAPWYERLPPDALAELQTLRARWVAGELGLKKRQLARAIIATCRDRGLYVVGVQGVEHWLNDGRAP